MKCVDLVLITLFCGLFLMFLIMQPHTQNTRPILEIEQIVYCNLDFNSSYNEKQEPLYEWQSTSDLIDNRDKNKIKGELPDFEKQEFNFRTDCPADCNRLGYSYFVEDYNDWFFFCPDHHPKCFDAWEQLQKEKQETKMKDMNVANAFDLNKWFSVEVDLSKVDFNSSLCKEGFTPRELSCSCHEQGCALYCYQCIKEDENKLKGILKVI